MRTKKRASKYSSMNKYIRALYTSNKKEIDEALSVRLGHTPRNTFNAFKSIYEDELNKAAFKKADKLEAANSLKLMEDEAISMGKSPKPFQLLNKILNNYGQRKVAIPYKSILRQTSLALTSRDYRSGLGVLDMLKKKDMSMFKALRRKTGWNTSIDPNRISFLRFHQYEAEDENGETVKIDENYISYVGLKGNYFFKIVGTHKKIDSMDITTFNVVEADSRDALKDARFNFVSNVRGSLESMDYTNADPNTLVSKDLPIKFRKFKHFYMGIKDHVI